MEHLSKRSRDDFEAGQDAPRNNGYDDNEKRHHIDPAQELINNVCKDIRRLGENPNIVNQVDDMLYMSNPIVAEFEKMENLRTAVLNTIYLVIVEQPQRISAIANLIFICNAKNFVVTRCILDFLMEKINSMLNSISDPAEIEEAPKTKKDQLKATEDAGAFNNIKSVTKFLATISPVIKNHAVLDVFDQFMHLAIGLQSKSEDRNGIAQEIFYNVLIAAPYLLSNDRSPELIEKLNSLVDLAQEFKIVESETSLLLQPFDSKLDNYDMPYVPKRMINLILAAIVSLQGPEKQWDLIDNSLFLNYQEATESIIKEALENNSISHEIVQHEIKPLVLPSIENAQAWSPAGIVDKLWHDSSRFLFQVYTLTEFDTVPPIETYIGLLFKDLSFDILTNLLFNKTEAAIQLCVLDIYFNKDLFAPPGSSIDQLSLIHKDNIEGLNKPPLSTYKIEDIAVESILTMIFQLPHPLHYEIYYYSVLISCCRENPELIAPVFGRAIRYFYNNLETLDYELKIRFLDWMTTQISNFEFSWKWDEWVADLQKFGALQYHPKRNFIKNLIAKEIRLLNVNVIRDSFVTVDPETQDVVPLTEFYQYLDVSFFELDNGKFVIDYDTDLYGDQPGVRDILAKLYTEKTEQLKLKLVVAPQEQMFYNFVNTDLPLWSIATKIYSFVVANWNTNTAFEALCVESLAAIKEQLPQVDAARFFINALIQTYSYIGSRSIYSVVNILSRDINKLKFVSGSPIEYAAGEPEYENPQLFAQESSQRQKWMVDAVFRVWSHQPQVVFLTVEYLIEFGIVDASLLLQKTLQLENNFIIKNVSCMESVNRILKLASELAERDQFKKLLTLLLQSIVANLNSVSDDLGGNNEDVIIINKELPQQSDETDEVANNVVAATDKQWLYYEYRGLLKSYIRKFVRNSEAEYLEEVRTICDQISNVPAREIVTTWLSEN